MVFNIPKGKWVTIGWAVGAGPRLYWKVATDRTCSWRRISWFPWGGTFVKTHSARLRFGLIQIKSPVDTTCVSSFSKAAVDSYPL